MSDQDQNTKIHETAPLGVGDLKRLIGACRWLTFLFTAVTIFGWSIAATNTGILLMAISAFAGWCALSCLIQYLFLKVDSGDRADAEYNEKLAKRRAQSEKNSDPMVTRAPFLPAFAARWQWAILFVGFLIIAGFFRGEYSQFHKAQIQDVTVLRVATVTYLATAGLLYFFVNFAEAVQARLETDLLRPILILSRIGMVLCLTTASVIFLFLTTSRDYTGLLGWCILAFTAILMIEPTIRCAACFYQPMALRTIPQPASHSLILDGVFGRGTNVRGALAQFEKVSGMKLGEMWMVRFLRRTLFTIVVGSLALGWLSTCLTAVPAGSRGVRVLLGTYGNSALGSGLHVTWPWPFEQIEVVATEQMRTVSLGFDKDLNEPVLWDEPHVQGEKNLLVGNGETLLTIDIPILYRISDPVAYLKNCSDPTQALANLAERRLLHVMGARDGFSVMINDRSAIAKALQEGLQSEVDRMNLGIEVVFVGLQDIHPPVGVAPAYQEVISAAEQKESLIDQAKTLRAGTLPAAQATANRLTTQADAEATSEIAAASGNAGRFLSLAKADAAYPDLLRLRYRMETIEQTLALPVKTIIAVPDTVSRQYYLDLRNTGDLPPP